MNKSIIAMQQDYRQFLNSFSKYLSADFNYNDVSIIVDEIEKFWLCRFNLIDQQLHFFSKDKDCMILSSETYLNYNVTSILSIHQLVTSMFWMIHL